MVPLSASERRARFVVMASRSERLFQLAIQVVNPATCWIFRAQKLGPVGNEVDAILEGLPVALLERRGLPFSSSHRQARGFQTKSADAVPGPRSTDSHLQRCPRLPQALTAQSPPQVLEEELRLSLLVSSQMLMAIPERKP